MNGGTGHLSENAQLSFVPANKNSDKRKINEDQRRNGVFIDVDCVTYKKINSVTVKVKKKRIYPLSGVTVRFSTFAAVFSI